MRNDIQTCGGAYFDFLQPSLQGITIEHIAHALSNICRFTGHTRQFYSVAQHSVLVASLVPPPYALQGLLHDAAEAFIGDVAKPLKELLPDYKAIERRVEAAVLQHYGLPAELHECVKHADLVALATEKRDLMPGTGDQWHGLERVQPHRDTILPMQPVWAESVFMTLYRQLTGRA